MQAASQTIYFDYQKNSFYRINKTTGESTKSYKNGNDLKSFKPNITGFNYKSRKMSNKSQQEKKINRISPNVFIKKQIELQRKTIDNFNDKSRSKEKLKNKSLSLHFEGQNLSQINVNPQINSSGQLKKKDLLSNLKQNKSELNNEQDVNVNDKSKTLFSLTLRKFSEVNKNREGQNNSLRKNIKGNQERTQNQIQKMIINLKSYKTLDPLTDGLKKQTKNKIIIKRSLNLPSFYSVKQQINRQTSLFFRIHPQKVKQQTQDMKKRQEQRRKNMKQLQQLFLKQNQSKTNSIYFHKVE